MAVSWPSDLPFLVLREGYEEGFKDIALYTKMDSGATKRRRRFSDAPEKYTLPIEFTSVQLDIFKEFYRVDLKGGSLSFSNPHPRTGASETWAFTGPIASVQASGFNTYIVKLPVEKLI